MHQLKGDLKTELEILLEKGLCDLGSYLGPRVYGEGIKGRAYRQDNEGRDTVANFQKREELLMPTEFRELSVLADLEEEQFMVAGGYIPFFRRQSGIVGGTYLIYDVCSSEELVKYYSERNRLIEQGKIAAEFITVCPERGSELINIEINGSTVKPNTLHVDLYADSLSSYFKAQKIQKAVAEKRIAVVKALHDQTFIPKDVCDALIGFVRPLM